MIPGFLFLVVLVLGGLIFTLFVGQRRRKRHGVAIASAPGSPDAPIFGEPKD